MVKEKITEMNKIVAKNRIYTALKYTGGFLVCNILLWAVIWLIAELDQDKLLNTDILQKHLIIKIICKELAPTRKYARVQ